MDRKPSENPEIERLIRIGRDSRSVMESEVAALRRRLDVPARIRGSLQQHPTGWLFGSLASGIAASLIFRRNKVVKPKSRPRLSRTLLGLSLTAARPLAKIWLSGQASQWASELALGKRQTIDRSNPQNTPNPPHVHSPGPGSR